MEVIEIKNRWTGAVLYSGEHADVKEAVEAAVKAGADLTGANLADAHGEGEWANIHAQHYIEALAFAKRLLKDQRDGAL